MASSRRGARPARGSLLRGVAGIAALYVALALVVAHLTRWEPGASSERAASSADAVGERLGSSGSGAAPGAPAPPAYVPPEVLALPVVIQQEPVVPLPPDREDRDDTLYDVRKQRVADMLEQQARRAEKARALRH